MEQATKTRTEATSASVSTRVTSARVAARNFDFFANSLANFNTVCFGFAVRNTYGVVARFLLSYAFPRSAANGFGSLFATELTNAAFFGASFASPFSNAAVSSSLFATELGNAAVTSSCFALPLTNAASFGSLFGLANCNAVGVRLFNTLELGNTNRNFAALDFWNPNASADGSVARSTTAWIACVATAVAVSTTRVASARSSRLATAAACSSVSTA